jgi:membrane-bound lytic murein transglycosylase D
MAAGTPQILLPWDNAEVFQNNMESYAGGRLASWTVWVAPSTMRPSDAAKRVGMSETELRSVNNIPARGMLIKAGSSLLVPRGARVTHDVSEHVADNGQMSLAPELALKRTMVRAGKSDDVASMARKYKVNAGDLARWNKVGTSARFKAGQQIVVYVAQTARPKATSTRSTRKQAPTQNRKQASTKRPAQVAKR